MENSDLTPSAWRTCRVLANTNRLRLLAAIIQRGPLAVSRAAQLAGVSEVTATLGLRALQSRGLLTSVRDSRWVRYAAQPDPLVSHAQAFLNATTRAITQRAATPELLKAFTAFTHPRRIRIVLALADTPLTAEQASVRCGISLPALRRHLAKLARRGVAIIDAEHRWHLTTPSLPLLWDLMLIVIAPLGAPAHTFEGVSARHLSSGKGKTSLKRGVVHSAHDSALPGPPHTTGAALCRRRPLATTGLRPRTVTAAPPP